MIGQLGMIGLAPGLPAAVRARIELLRERARAGLAVTCGGVSMEPAIARGDVVMVRSGWPRTGDVAAFVTRGGQVMKVLPKGYELSDVALAHIAKLARYDSITDPVEILLRQQPRQRRLTTQSR